MRFASPHLSRCFFVAMISATLLGAANLAAGEAAFVRVPLGDGQQGAENLAAVPLPGVTVSAQPLRTAKANGAGGTRLTFQKSGDERRIAALEGRPAGPLSEKMALELQCRLAMEEGAARLALILYERDGGAWYRILRTGLPAGERSDVRIPLSKSLVRPGFAHDEQEAVNWDQIDRAWVAILLDGPARGSFELTRVQFTDEPFRPTAPLTVEGDWQSAHDPAVEDRIAMEKTDSSGGACMTYTFDMPGRRHMYAIPRVPVAVEELDGYSALRFTYRAELPEGINGLLVMLMEADGTQYCAEPPPPTSPEWTTVTIPFDRFQRGGWSKDENERLDLNDVRHVAVGMHGTAKAEKASGKILVSRVEFLP